jgi:hypothetical protein
MPKPNLKFIEISVYDHSRATINWVDVNTGDQYHVWVTIPEFIIQNGLGSTKPTLYKNPKAGIQLYAKGDFSTRLLDASKPQWSKMINQTVAYIKGNGLLAEAHDKVKKNKHEEKILARQTSDNRLADHIREYCSRYMDVDEITGLNKKTNSDILNIMREALMKEVILA